MTRKFTNETFHQEFIFIKCSRKTAEKKLQIDIDDDTDGLCSIMDDGTVMIWVCKDAHDSVLVHECVHAAMFALDRAGVKQIDTELMAYMTREIWIKCIC